jgi:hypothetical protein
MKAIENILGAKIMKKRMINWRSKIQGIFFKYLVDYFTRQRKTFELYIIEKSIWS